jgi:hypothetical protein
MGKNQDPGSGINIPDPQHCPIYCMLKLLELNGTVSNNNIHE